MQPQPVGMLPHHPPNQQGAIVIAEQQRPADDNKFTPSSLSQMKGLSITQIVLGILCIILGVVLIILDEVDEYGSGITYIAYGIWIGIIYLVVGIVGYSAAKAGNNESKTTAAMVLNIICSSAFCILLLSFASAGIDYTNANSCDYTYFYFFSTNCKNGVTSSMLAMDSMLLIISFIEFVVTIWSACLCCGAVCRCCKSYGGHVVQYRAVQGTAVYPAGVPMTTTVVQYSNQQTSSSRHSAKVSPSRQDPVGVHQTGGYIVQQPHMYYSAAPPYQQQQMQPPAQHGYQAQGPTGYPPQAQPSAQQGYPPAQPAAGFSQAPTGYPPQTGGYQPPPAYQPSYDSNQQTK